MNSGSGRRTEVWRGGGGAEGGRASRSNLTFPPLPCLPPLCTPATQANLESVSNEKNMYFLISLFLHLAHLNLSQYTALFSFEVGME